MKIDFEMLDRLEAAGATAKVVIEMLKMQYVAYDAKKSAKRLRDAERICTKRAATKRDKVTTVGDIERQTATVGDIPNVATDSFDDFMKAYPKRDGANPKTPARKTFLVHLKSGIEAKEIIAGAKRYSDEARRKGEYGTPFVPQAVKWLNQRRWIDYEPETELPPAGFRAEPDSDELVAWEEHRMATEGKSWPRDKNGGWTFPTQWPPGYAPPAEPISQLAPE